MKINLVSRQENTIFSGYDLIKAALEAGFTVHCPSAGEQDISYRASNIGEDILPLYIRIHEKRLREEYPHLLWSDDDRRFPIRYTIRGLSYESAIISQLPSLGFNLISRQLDTECHAGIKGHPDIVAEDEDGQPWVIEVKVLNANSYKEMLENINLKQNYATQLGLYSLALDTSAAFIIVNEESDEMEMAFIDCSYDYDSLKSFVSRQVDILNNPNYLKHSVEVPFRLYRGKNYPAYSMYRQPLDRRYFYVFSESNPKEVEGVYSKPHFQLELENT